MSLEASETSSEAFDKPSEASELLEVASQMPSEALNGR
jgi:hypothetical protein